MDRFKTLSELAEEENRETERVAERSLNQSQPMPSTFPGDEEEPSLRSLYVSTQEGTMSSRTSSINLLQSVEHPIEDCEKSLPPNPSGPTQGELSPPDSERAFQMKQELGIQQIKDKSSMLIQAAGVAQEPVILLDLPSTKGHGKDQPRRLLSEAESLAMPDCFSAGGYCRDEIAQEELEVVPARENENNQDGHLKLDTTAHKAHIGELESLVEYLQSRIAQLEQQLEVQRQAEQKEDQPDHEPLAQCDQDFSDEQLERGYGDNEIGVGNEGGRDEQGGGYDTTIVIEELQEENRYLKVVYTERISQLVAENGILRDKLQAVEQLIDEVPHMGDLGHSRRPGSRVMTGPGQHRHGLMDEAMIGYSPLGAGRLLYSEFH